MFLRAGLLTMAARKASVRKDAPWGITATEVKNDLTRGKGRPEWLLSTYGPGKGPPASLLEGNEYSFEELRVRFYEFKAAGNEDQANQEAGGLWAKAEQAMTDVANNAENVTKFMDEANNKHPNRQDFCKVDGTKSREQVAKDAESSNAFGNSSVSGQSTTFGQSSGASTAFGQPAFGRPSATGLGGGAFGKPAQPSAFGQPSGAFGQPSTSAFGKPSTGFGQPPFGQSSRPTTAFGQPSQPTPAFGQPAQSSGFGTGGFGQPPDLSGKSPFTNTSAPSAFGQPSQATTAFGQPSNPGFGAGTSVPQSSAFGQPSQPSNPFGQTSQTGPNFGQSSKPSAFGQPSQPSAFGQPTQPSPAFGQPSKPSAFGQPTQPSAFGQPTQPSAFGQPSQTTPAFGQPSQPSAFGQSSQPGSAFGKSAQPSPFAQPVTTTSVFGQSSTTATAFGQTSNSAFGTPSAPINAFSQPASSEGNASSTPAFGSTAFGQPVPAAATSSKENPFAASSGARDTGFGSAAVTRTSPLSNPPVLSANANSSSTPHPLTKKPHRPVHYTETIPVNAPTIVDPQNKRLRTYRGRPVKYIDEHPCYDRPDRKGWERIWFPQDSTSPDVVALGKEGKVVDLVAEPEKYTEEVILQFAHLFEMGTFKDGKMPDVPPLREWCVYNF